MERKPPSNINGTTNRFHEAQLAGSGSYDYSQLRVKQSRLMDAIHGSCKFGQCHRYGDHPTETGMSRLSLNAADKYVRNWFVDTARELDCKITIDKMGNIFAVRPGKNSAAPPIFMGSHLDTQPTGGRYDGILGVNAGLEVLKILHEHNVETEGSVGVVDWTNEEGARFPMMAVASGVWAEEVPLEEAWALLEVTPGEDGVKRAMKQELQRIGFLGSAESSYKSNPFAAHFELHIEQGPILENESRKIGVVEGAQAFKWFEISVKGRGTHTGTTPFNARKDAMLCAARLIVQSNAIAKYHGGLCTTGVLSLQPGSINTIPETVTFGLDMRHTSNASLAAIEEACRADFARIATECERGCVVQWKSLVDSPAVRFHKDCISVVEASAAEVCGDGKKTEDTEGSLWKYMVSGAGHDSCYTSKRCPTSMIFIPSKEGVSHNPEEYSSPEDCAMGTQVLLGAVLRYDQLRAQKGDFSKN